MIEKYKEINGFEGRYKISNYGNVYSMITNKILSPKVDKDGYLEVGLVRSDGKRIYKRVHRLVAEAFISNDKSYPQINHIDDNKQNNNVCNLEWCTAKQNNNHGNRKECYKRMKRDEKGRFVCVGSI